MINPVGPKVSRTTKFLRSEALGKVLDVAADNQALCSSLFALGICLGPRPLTNFAITKDKQDATYASCHSISSGVIGYLWPLAFVTPIALSMKKIAKDPTKYLKAETIKKFYPNVQTKEVFKDGKSILEVVKNDAGKMVDNEGRELFKGHEPLMIYNKEVRAKFNANYPNHYVEEKTGVVRSKLVPKTKDGKVEIKGGVQVGAPIQAKEYELCDDGLLRIFEKDKKGKPILDAEGNRVGRVVEESDLSAITEEMEIGARKEQNVQKIVNMVPDILLAPFRASLTIALIPPVLKLFGIKKSDKSKGGKPAPQVPLNMVSTSNNTVVKSAPVMQAPIQVKKGAA